MWECQRSKTNNPLLPLKKKKKEFLRRSLKVERNLCRLFKRCTTNNVLGEIV